MTLSEEKMSKKWWEGKEPVYQGESDGQVMTWVYTRLVDVGKFYFVPEYAVVHHSDGDGPDSCLGGLLLCDGKVTPIEPG